MKTKLILSVFAIFFAINTVSAKEIKSLTLKVEDMMCEIHEAKITNMLRFEKGVKEIKTDVPSRIVIIKYDAEKNTPEKLIKLAFVQIISKHSADPLFLDMFTS